MSGNLEPAYKLEIPHLKESSVSANFWVNLGQKMVIFKVFLQFCSFEAT